MIDRVLIIDDDERLAAMLPATSARAATRSIIAPTDGRG